MTEITHANIKGTKQAKAESSDKRKKYEKVLKRMEAKNENRISGILTMNIDEMKKSEWLLEDHLKFMAEVVECLESYHYNFEQQDLGEGDVGYFFYTPIFLYT